jgi:isochorismate pyruvate lyase
MINPEQCQTMAEVRNGIDALDEEIVGLLVTRFRFIEAAARIKPRREDVRDETRKAEVVERARVAALKAGIPEGLIAQLYEVLVEGSITHEFARFDARQPDEDGARLADKQGVKTGAGTTLPSTR